ncbi:hypothetical protein G6011_00160 [Alternaria panax]|uniref:Uncharacterized protein n=1 Tax=Alternaria panax TaxID=48097 RepID=A0AAD4NVH1_9PLEO|nr:hypothetical protein G6011_00160 [Alternaria panax]
MGLEARMPPLHPDLDASDNEASSSGEAAAQLPALTAMPTAYPGCCLALSESLIGYLGSLLPQPPSLALSIGSGFGLLESYLIVQPHAHHVIGVEVEPSSNQYLPPSNHRVVHGSRFLAPLAAEATTWLFVYPRRVGLLREYLAEHGEGSVKRGIWAGPKADWDDYKACFAGWHVEEQSADQVGGRAWELIAVANRASP